MTQEIRPLTGGNTIQFELNESAGVSAGDLLEIEAAGTVKAITTSATAFIGVAVTDADDNDNFAVQIDGVIYALAGSDLDCGIDVKPSTSAAGQVVAFVEGTDNPDDLIGRIIAKSATTNGRYIRLR